MEGLLLAQALDRLGTLPQATGNWRFPDPDTFILPVGEASLWILSTPKSPLLEVRTARSPSAGRGSSFQQLLQSRTSGELLAVQQSGLDRVANLQFGPGSGFVRTEPAVLHVELAGRNSNLILTDAAGRILGVQREVGSDRNRFRQLLPGLTYRPPPEYDRPDPRVLGPQGVAALLLDRPLSDLRKVVDGVGPELTAVVSRLSGIPASEPVTASQLPELEAALEQLLADPAAARARVLGTGDLSDLRRQDERTALLRRLEPALLSRISLLERRLADVERLEQAAEGASELRRQAGLLLTWRPSVEPGSTVTLQDYDGETVTVRLEPGQDAIRTAETFFNRARRNEQRLKTARELTPALNQQLDDTRQELARLPDLELTELRRQASEAAPARGQHRTQPGIRVEGPQGFEIVIGRNSRDNDQVTFSVARSRDVWLHVQGYRGSHVIIRAGNREVPFETILFAARLAAGHSQAAESGNVPVDYTLRKNVWRPKGAAAGAVHFRDQKTVYVTPLRNATREESPGV